MNDIGFFVGLALGALLTGLVLWSWLRGRYEGRLVAASTQAALLRERVVDLESQLGDDQQTAQALAPLSSTLARVERQVEAIERERATQYGALGAQLRAVSETTGALHQQTSALAGALKSSNTSGAWGEMQLRRVLEHAGLLRHCDFDEQVRSISRHGKEIRPDAVVRLPGEKVLVIDSKAPVQHFLAAHAEGVDDTEREQLLHAHSRALRGHVESLAAKDYWSGFAAAPEAVLCFVPSEAMLAAAVRAEPDVIDRAMARRVLLVSPATLLSALQTTALVWRQDTLESNAHELLTLGRELYERLGTLGRHTSKMGDSLRRSVEAYNALVGTLETRVLVSARRMESLGVGSDPVPQVPAVEQAPRPLTAAELIDALDEDVQRPQLRFDLPTPDRRPDSGTASESA
ncbi:DNA recombination protein RmuC [Yimella sp. cx-573]|nr:DNA recombination protein RmuC [Yimella sp. cx-573]